MSFIDLPIFRSFSIGGITVVLLSVLAGNTLLPALLGILGPRIDALLYSCRLPDAPGTADLRFVEKALQICHGASCDHLYRGDRFTIGGDLSGSGHEHRHPREVPPPMNPDMDMTCSHRLMMSVN